MRQHATPTRALGLVCLAVALALLAACGGAASGATTTYDAGPGHIVVQLFPQAGFIAPGATALPSWTLYGDGTLVYTTGGVAPGSAHLMTAKLSPSDVNTVLDFIVNQHHFFASTKQAYGHGVPDTGSTRLTVNANGQSKSVVLFAEPGPAPDTQTTDVFAIEHYLQAYSPPSPVPYVAPGVALLVTARLSPSEVVDGAPPVQWPYSDVDLSQAYALSCGYVHTDASCTGPAGTQAQLLGVYGSRAQDILTLTAGHLIHAQQGTYVYAVSAFPLLPDALVSQNGHAPGVLVNGTDRLRLQPAPPSNG